MKYFIISMPKSGTYLLSNLLEKFGIEQSYLHIGLTKYQKYDPKNLYDGRLNPLNYTHELDIKESLKLIKENQVAVGHIPYNDTTNELLKDFKKIIITRKIDDINESAKRWQKISRRGNSERTNVKLRKINAVLEWKNKENIFHIEFDDIINLNEKKIDDLQIYLLGNIRFDSILSTKTSLSEKTLTKSHIR